MYNEAESLSSLLEKIRELKSNLNERVAVVAVDDGSRDASPDIVSEAAKEIELVCITHPQNKGLRETMQDGYEGAARMVESDDVVVTLDADDTQNPRYVKAMLEKLDEGFDVVIASRYQRGATVMGVPWFRRLFSFGANLLCCIFLRVKNVRDYACGFRAFRGNVIKDCVDYYGKDFLGIRGFGFICAVEAIVKVAARGASFAEIPFELRYDLKEGNSKMHVGRTIMGYFLLIRKSRKIRRGSKG